MPLVAICEVGFIFQRSTPQLVISVIAWMRRCTASHSFLSFVYFLFPLFIFCFHSLFFFSFLFLHFSLHFCFWKSWCQCRSTPSSQVFIFERPWTPRLVWCTPWPQMYPTPCGLWVIKLGLTLKKGQVSCHCFDNLESLKKLRASNASMPTILPCWFILPATGSSFGLNCRRKRKRSSLARIQCGRRGISQS